MVHYVHFKSPFEEEIEDYFKNLPLCPGVCIFIDIVNSTNIKYHSEVWEWGRKLNNTFNFISFLNDFPDNIVKGIGDEIMLYIPTASLREKDTYKSLAGLLGEIYASLDTIKNFPVDGLFLQCKVAMHYCTDVYNISFLEGFNDYYGKDIDLSARLMSKAKANRIVISQCFYDKMLEDQKQYPEENPKECLSRISPTYIEDFKGVPEPTEFRIIDI